MNNNYSKTRIITECALLIALGTVLAQIKLFRMPSGGSVTAASMLPFIMVSFRHGTKWGVIAGIANSLLQIFLGGLYTPPAGTFIALLGSVLLDYAIAYIALGFAQEFSKPFGKEKRFAGVMFGTLMVCLIRFICSFLSGFIIWGSIAEDGFGAVTYSLTYNASYLVPETVITMLLLAILFKKAPQLFKSID